MSPSERTSRRFDMRYPAWVTVVLTLLLLLLTLYLIRESRQDSYELLAEQGRAFTEALAQASDNAVVAETYYDYFIRARFSDLVVTLVNWNIDRLTEQNWTSFTLSHDLLGAYVYDTSASIVAGVTVRGSRTAPPEFVRAEVEELFQEPELRFVLLLDEGTNPGEAIHYYLELTSHLDQVVVLVADAQFFIESLSETGIEHLVQMMAREPGVEYIAYQTTDGIIFSSRSVSDLGAIETDPFLTAALDADSIVERVSEFQGDHILELARPFSTARDPFGLFRVGLSLDRYYAVRRGHIQQAIILSAVLFVLMGVALAYFRGRRKRAEMIEKYERQAERRERLSEMGNLAAGVAHEIRNPLNTISIAAQRLEREFRPTENNDQYESFTRQIRTETRRLNETITRFLALAREGHKQSEPIELKPVLQEIGRLLQVEGEKIGLDVSVEVEDGIRVRGDRDRLKEVFLNLFNNSKEALEGSSGGFAITAKREKDRIEIVVEDTGPGIRSEDRERVFAPYYTTKEGGTGLGLPTVQKIISDMGGEVTIDTNAGEGTRIVISLPDAG